MRHLADPRVDLAPRRMSVCSLHEDECMPAGLPRALEYGYSMIERRMPLSLLYVLLMVLGTTHVSCRGTNETLSGRYVEIRQGVSEELLVLDLFRYGNYLKGVLRLYRVPQSSSARELFDDQITCSWSSVTDAPVEEDGSFVLTIPSWREQGPLDIEGVFGDESAIDATVILREDDDDEEREVRAFEFLSNRPVDSCEEIDPFLIQPDFEIRGEENVFSSRDDTRRIENPVFAVLWLGVQGRITNSIKVWIAKNIVGSNFYLGSRHIGAQGRGLEGSLRLSVFPPEDRAMTQSGATRFAFGHFVVIDDRCAQPPCTQGAQDRFTWNISSEPIIATSVEAGVIVDETRPEITGVGKALFWVEGRLSELDKSLRDTIIHIDLYTQDPSLDAAHFFIVDFLFDDNGNVVELILPSRTASLTRSTYRVIPIRVTEEYIDSDEILLPRVVPLDDL